MNGWVLQTSGSAFIVGFQEQWKNWKPVLEIYNKQKENIYAIINNFNLFTPATKKELIDYLDEAFLQNYKRSCFDKVDVYYECTGGVEESITFTTRLKKEGASNNLINN